MSSAAYDEQRSQSMKTAIAIIMTSVSGGGTPRHAFEMAREWSHQGEDVLFIQTFRRLIKVYFYKEGKVQHIIRFWDKEENVYGEIRSAGIDFFWFPGVCPETYSYMLSIPIRLHIPCLASDLGAIASRIHSHHWGETYPWEAGTDEIVHRLLAFDYHRYANPDFTIENTSFGSVEDFYRGVPYKREEPCDEEQVAFPTAFSELPAILHREEFNELWQGASLFQKVQLLTHMDRDWLLSVW